MKKEFPYKPYKPSCPSVGWSVGRTFGFETQLAVISEKRTKRKTKMYRFARSLLNLDGVWVELQGAGDEEGGPAVAEDDGEAAEKRRVGHLTYIALVHQGNS